MCTFFLQNAFRLARIAKDLAIPAASAAIGIAAHQAVRRDMQQKGEEVRAMYGNNAAIIWKPPFVGMDSATHSSVPEGNIVIAHVDRDRKEVVVETIGWFS